MTKPAPFEYREGNYTLKTMTVIVKAKERHYYLTDHLACSPKPDEGEGSIRTTVDGLGTNRGSVTKLG